jgi:hypothetical protein
MKQIRAMLMLGPFGLMLLVAMVLIGIAIASVFRVTDSLDTVYILAEQRLGYQYAESDLLEMETLSRQSILAELQNEPETQTRLAEQHQVIEQRLNTRLTELEILGYLPRHTEIVREIGRRRDLITENFTNTQKAVENEDFEYDTLDARLDVLLNSERPVNDETRALILSTEAELNSELQQLEWDKSFFVWVVLATLMVFPLLAVWAFVLASGFTQPLLQIVNAVMAVGGDHYRPSLLEGILKRRDSLGNLANAVDRMAMALNQRDAALVQEVAGLRRQVQEIRRARLATAVDIPVSELIGGKNV